MCGILFTTNSEIAEDKFTSALRMMKHRGPDSEGLENVSGLWLGHVRLKIQDLDDRSNQPYISTDGRYIIIFNGEIYNYEELARAHGISQKTTSDTEVLIELYSKYGKDMLQFLNGMFAFVIYDKIDRSVFVARDRLGIKPLYVSSHKGHMYLASEIAPLLALTDDRRLDDVGVRQYRKLRTFFRGHTLYSSVKMFPAGHFMMNGKISKYWELPNGDKNPPSDEELRDLIETSVKYRCISDVAVGSYLSGGLDSTIVAALSKKPDTWTVGFKDFNEFKWAKKASNKFGSTHHEIVIDKDEYLSTAQMMIRQRMEPLSVPNEVLLYSMTKQVQIKNSVVLSGEGADELFFGYDRIYRWAASNKWDIHEFSRLYSYGSNDDIEIVEYALEPYLKCANALETVSSFFQISHLHGLLRRLDNSTMMCSVEARVPFVDHRLIERLSSVGINYKMQDGVVKAPLKRLYAEIIPKEIIERKKIGFPVPVDIIFENNGSAGNMDSWLEFNLNEVMIY